MDITPYLLLATLEGLVQASVFMLTALGLKVDIRISEAA